MNKLSIIVVGAIAVAALTISIYGLQGDRIVYFDYNKVYNDSDIKNKLEKDLKMVGGKRQSELDSMQMELSFMSKRIAENTSSAQEVSDFEELKERFLMLQQKYEEESIRLKETYFSQIRKEINDKAILFSEENGYDFVFAAMGDGALMYGKETFDVTDEFKKYVNRK